MTCDPTAQPINQPRRKDRTIQDDAWIMEFLARKGWGVLATSSEGQPFTNANLFVYDLPSHSLYLHTARDGRTPFNLAANPRVCFSVSEMGRLLPADTAMEFSVEYQSVVIFGQARTVADEVEAARGMQLLLDKYFPHLRPGSDYRPIQARELALTAVFRVDIESWSAKRKAAAEDFPGAFIFGDKPRQGSIKR